MSDLFRSSGLSTLAASEDPQKQNLDRQYQSASPTMRPAAMQRQPTNWKNCCPTPPKATKSMSYLAWSTPRFRE